MHKQLSKSLALALLFLPMSGVAQGDSRPQMLAPAPTYYEDASEPRSSWLGLDIPERLWTVENGIRIPHPVRKDGRILMPSALKYYVEHKGLNWHRGDIFIVVSDYLLLAALKQNPGLLEEFPHTYAYRFLTQADKGLLPCEVDGRERPPPCDLTFAEVSLVGHGSLDYVVAFDILNVDEHRRQLRINLAEKKSQLLAAAPALPIRFTGLGSLQISTENDSAGGLTYRWGLPGGHAFYGGSYRQVALHYLVSDGESGNETSQGPSIVQRPTEGTPLGKLIPDILKGQPTCCGPQYHNVGAGLESVSRVDENAARELMDRFDGTMFVEIGVDLVDTTTDFRQTYWQWKARLQSATAYEDSLLEHELHRFDCMVIPGCTETGQQ
jgi:hypothetical protein